MQRGLGDEGKMTEGVGRPLPVFLVLWDFVEDLCTWQYAQHLYSTMDNNQLSVYYVTDQSWNILLIICTKGLDMLLSHSLSHALSHIHT